MRTLATGFAGLLLAGACLAQELRLPMGKELSAGGFVTTRGEIPGLNTEVKVRRDAENLYLTIFNELEPGTRPKVAGHRDDDVSIFGGEVVEVILSPEPESGVYYHLAVNPNGALYSAKKRDMSWNPPVSRKIDWKDSGWSAGLVIPFSAFGGKEPGAGTAWGVNFASGRTVQGGYSANWSGASDYHDVKQLGKLIFSGGEKQETAEIRKLVLRNNTVFLELGISGKTAGGFPWIRVTLNGQKYEPEKMESGGGCMASSWKIPLSQDYLPQKSSHILEVLAKDKPDGRVLFHKKALANSAHAGDLKLDRFYYTYDDGKINYSHDFAEPAEITVSRDGKVCRTIRNAEKTGVFYFAGPPTGKKAAPGLAPGRYVMEVSSGNKRTSRVFFILGKVPAPVPIRAEAELKIDGDIFTLDGMPVFLLGGSPTGKAFLQFGDAFNVDYGRYGVQPNAVQILGIPGYHLTRQPATGYVFPPDAGFKRIVDKSLESGGKMKRFFTRIAYEAQMNVYEKNADGKLTEKNPPEFYAGLYRHLKAKAPERYFSIHIDHHGNLKEFASVCDIFETACWSSSFSPAMIPNLVRDMKEAKTAAGCKPVIFWLGGTIPNVSCRTAEELRAGIYLAVIHDLAGIILHMGHGYLPQERSRLWSLISGVNAEIQRFYPEFRKGGLLRDFVLKSSEGFAYAARKSGDKVILVAVNLSGGEKRLAMKTVNGDIDDVFTPYEPKVYEAEKQGIAELPL